MIRKIFKAFLFLIGGLLVILIGISVFLWIKSPGKATPITDPEGKIIPGSISVIEKIELGGLAQYLIIRGTDTTKPIMLFLHGGPGSPETAFIKHFNPGIEDNFVMVYWEQAGAGKSFSKDIPVDHMNLKQFIADTRELSLYLAKRFQREKIYIMGHSWGSMLGILTAYENPELYHAYFGIGQVVYQYNAEAISLAWVKEQAQSHNDRKATKILSGLSFPDSLASNSAWLDYTYAERRFVAKYGGAMHGMESMWPLIKLVLYAKEYTFADKVNFMRGNMFSTENLWNEVIRTNLNTEIDSMQVPVYIFQGIHDYQTPYIVAKDFYNQLKAPKKDLFTFENSAHSPIMEEAEKFNQILGGLILAP